MSLMALNEVFTQTQAKNLAIELFKWFGVAIKPTLEKNLKPVQVC